jgi:hypothetical protein
MKQLVNSLLPNCFGKIKKIEAELEEKMKKRSARLNALII